MSHETRPSEPTRNRLPQLGHWSCSLIRTTHAQFGQVDTENSSIAGHVIRLAIAGPCHLPLAGQNTFRDIFRHERRVADVLQFLPFQTNVGAILLIMGDYVRNKTLNTSRVYLGRHDKCANPPLTAVIVVDLKHIP